MTKEYFPQGVAWDAEAGRLYLITSGPERAASADYENFITALTVSQQPGVLAQEVIVVKDTAGNRVKAIKAAGMVLKETGSGLIAGPGSTLYFLGTDTLFQVSLADGSLNRIGEPFAGQHLWGGAIDSGGTIYLSSNVAGYDPEEGGAGQGTIWRLNSDGTREAMVEGIAAPLGLVWRNGYLYIADRATGSIFKVAATQTPAQEEVSTGNAPPALTATEPGPSSSPTPIQPTPSSTASPAPTNTPVSVEPTTAPTQTPVPTDTPLPTPTNTPSPTWTPAPPPLTVQAETIARLDSRWVKRVVWSPDGSLLAVASTGLQLYRTDDFTERLALSGSDWVFDAVFSPDGQMVATAFMAGKDVTLWTPDGGELLSFPGSENAARIAFSLDGRLLAATVGGAVKVWNVDSGEELRTIPAGSSAGPVAFSPDGKLLAAMAGVAGMEIKVWETANWTEQFTLSGHSNWIRSIVFAPDGKTIASGSVDGTIRLWDTENGRQLRVFAGHTNDVEEVAFSPDGRLLASASWDLTVRLWDVASGVEVAQLTGHTGWITTVAFSPDGTMLASGAEDQAARVWQLDISAP
jgi:WD40 repeat protein